MIRKIFSRIRYKTIKPFIKGLSLDIGSKWYNEIFDFQCDLHPKHHMIMKENIENLSYEDDSFYTVSCLEVLEHVRNPIKAIEEIKRVSKNRIIISIPYEPMFSVLRLGWEKEHLWALTPKLLKLYLGKPIFKKVLLFRWYIGVWEK